MDLKLVSRNAQLGKLLSHLRVSSFTSMAPSRRPSTDQLRVLISLVAIYYDHLEDPRLPRGVLEANEGINHEVFAAYYARPTQVLKCVQRTLRIVDSGGIRPENVAFARKTLSEIQTPSRLGDSLTNICEFLIGFLRFYDLFFPTSGTTHPKKFSFAQKSQNFANCHSPVVKKSSSVSLSAARTSRFASKDTPREGNLHKSTQKKPTSSVRNIILTPYFEEDRENFNDQNDFGQRNEYFDTDFNRKTQTAIRKESSVAADRGSRRNQLTPSDSKPATEPINCFGLLSLSPEKEKETFEKHSKKQKSGNHSEQKEHFEFLCHETISQKPKVQSVQPQPPQHSTTTRGANHSSESSACKRPKSLQRPEDTNRTRPGLSIEPLRTIASQKTTQTNKKQLDCEYGSNLRHSKMNPPFTPPFESPIKPRVNQKSKSPFAKKDVSSKEVSFAGLESSFSDPHSSSKKHPAPKPTLVFSNLIKADPSEHSLSKQKSRIAESGLSSEKNDIRISSQILSQKCSKISSPQNSVVKAIRENLQVASKMSQVVSLEQPFFQPKVASRFLSPEPEPKSREVSKDLTPSKNHSQENKSNLNFTQIKRSAQMESKKHTPSKNYSRSPQASPESKKSFAILSRQNSESSSKKPLQSLRSISLEFEKSFRSKNNLKSENETTINAPRSFVRDYIAIKDIREQFVSQSNRLGKEKMLLNELKHQASKFKFMIDREAAERVREETEERLRENAYYRNYTQGPRLIESSYRKKLNSNYSIDKENIPNLSRQTPTISGQLSSFGEGLTRAEWKRTSPEVRRRLYEFTKKTEELSELERQKKNLLQEIEFLQARLKGPLANRP